MDVAVFVADDHPVGGDVAGGSRWASAAPSDDSVSSPATTAKTHVKEVAVFLDRPSAGKPTQTHTHTPAVD